MPLFTATGGCIGVSPIPRSPAAGEPDPRTPVLDPISPKEATKMLSNNSFTKIAGALIAAICCAAALVAAAPASADSLVFVKEGNVWLSNPDGSGQYQVTTDGSAANPYISPSQADDGTIVAGRAQPMGAPLVRLKQNGELINQIPVGPIPVAGPFDAQVSPDGAMVAFEHVFSRVINGYLETSSDVRFTRTDGSTPNGIGEVARGAGAPSWIDSTHAFVGVNQTAYTVVPGQAPVEWWNDYQHQPPFNLGETVEDGEYAPNGLVAVVRGENSWGTIQLYRANGSFTTPPTPTCTLSQPSPGPAGEEFKDPTFSPSGNSLAWQEGNGVWAMDSLTDCGHGNPHLLIPGASEPDWGPAAVDPPARVPATLPPVSAPPSKAPASGRGTGSGKSATTQSGAALAKGVKLNLTAPAAGRYVIVARLGGKVVGTTSKTVPKAGKTNLVVPFSAAGRKLLAGRQTATLKVAIRFSPRRGGAAKTSNRTVHLG
jgi:hypothetical protein